jgi:hypothetical protein
VSGGKEGFMRRFALTACVTLACLLPAELARADPFTLSLTINTQGRFGCRGDVAGCSASGNSVVLGTGSNTATLTFTGVDSTFDVTNVSRRVFLGRFTSTGSEGFTFPTRTNPNVPILQFNFQLTHTSPFDDTNIKPWNFGPGGGTTLRFMIGHTASGIFIPPSISAGSGYDMIVYSYLPGGPPSLNGVGSTDLFADVGVIPEPATMILVGAGLAGVVARRRKRTDDVASTQ